MATSGKDGADGGRALLDELEASGALAQVQATKEKLRALLQTMKDDPSAISLAEMMEMQMLMNHMSQLSEMSTSTLAALNSALSSMARNVKG